MPCGFAIEQCSEFNALRRIALNVEIGEASNLDIKEVCANRIPKCAFFVLQVTGINEWMQNALSYQLFGS